MSFPGCLDSVFIAFGLWYPSVQVGPLVSFPRAREMPDWQGSRSICPDSLASGGQQGREQCQCGGKNRGNLVIPGRDVCFLPGQHLILSTLWVSSKRPGLDSTPLLFLGHILPASQVFGQRQPVCLHKLIKGYSPMASWAERWCVAGTRVKLYLVKRNDCGGSVQGEPWEALGWFRCSFGCIQTGWL